MGIGGAGRGVGPCKGLGGGGGVVGKGLAVCGKRCEGRWVGCWEWRVVYLGSGSDVVCDKGEGPCKGVLSPEGVGPWCPSIAGIHYDIKAFFLGSFCSLLLVEGWLFSSLGPFSFFVYLILSGLGSQEALFFLVEGGGGSFSG